MGSIALWIVATLVLAVAPLVYFVAGGTDAATEGDRVGLAAAVMVVAWLPLVAAFALVPRRSGTATLRRAAPRAFVLVVLAAVLFGSARALASRSAFTGDGAWAAYWCASLAVWTAASLALIKRAARK